jgi:hypothetical protein
MAARSTWVLGVLAAQWLAAAAPAQPSTATEQDGRPVPSIEVLWQIVQDQQAQIEALESALAATEQTVASTAAGAETTAQQVAATSAYLEGLDVTATPTTQLGGYGELHLSDVAADTPAGDSRDIDYHRFVLLFSHRFNDSVRFFSELELEHALAGDGEPGAVELEQAFVDFALGPSTSLAAGVFLLPIGILNETHEPPTFYGVERNDVESIIVPATWREAGAALRRHYANGMSWDLALHSGLAIPTTGANAFRVRSGRQEGAEALANDPALTLRMRYTGVTGLDLAASFQYQSDASQTAADGLDAGTLVTAHAIYQRGDFLLKGLYGRWSLDGVAVEAANADRQTGWYLEPSFALSPRWGVYARYEDIAGARALDQFTQWEGGFNYWPLANVVVKFDYRQREHTQTALAGQNFDAVDVGLGYQF